MPPIGFVYESLPMMKAMGPKPPYVALTHSVPPGFEDRAPILRPRYKNLCDQWGIQGHEGPNCLTKSNCHTTATHFVSPTAPHFMTTLASSLAMKNSLPRQPTIKPNTQIRREPRHEYIHEYIATTPQYDEQGHHLFPTYYLQDSEGLMPV